MAIVLTLEEMETSLNMTADDRGTWHIFSDDAVMQRRLEKIGAKLVRSADAGIGKFYELPANQVSFRRQLTDEQKAKRAAHLVARNTRGGNVDGDE